MTQHKTIDEINLLIGYDRDEALNKYHNYLKKERHKDKLQQKKEDNIKYKIKRMNDNE